MTPLAKSEKNGIQLFFQFHSGEGIAVEEVESGLGDCFGGGFGNDKASVWSDFFLRVQIQKKGKTQKKKKYLN